MARFKADQLVRCIETFFAEGIPGAIRKDTVHHGGDEVVKKYPDLFISADATDAELLAHRTKVFPLR